MRNALPLVTDTAAFFHLEPRHTFQCIAYTAVERGNEGFDVIVYGIARSDNAWFFANGHFIQMDMLMVQRDIVEGLVSFELNPYRMVGYMGNFQIIVCEYDSIG